MSPSRLLTVLSLSLALPSLGEAQEAIRWRAGAAIAPTTDSASTQVELATGLQAGERHYVLRLSDRTSARMRQDLAAVGVELTAYLGANAWFVSVDPMRLDLTALTSPPIVPSMRGIARVDRGWKLHPSIAAGSYPDHARLDAVDAEDPTVAAYVVLHADVDVNAEASRALVEKLDVRVRDVLETIGGFVVELPQSRLDALASLDIVQWIEPAMPRMSDVSMPNDSNRARVQADPLQVGPYNLDGSGVSVMVYDGGFARDSHQDFGGRLSVHDSSGLSNHATHVAGTIGGSGAAGGGTHRGMAPGVDLVSYGFEFDGSGIFLYSNPGDLENDYDDAINVRGADLSNNSIGTNTEPNGFPCNLQGDYGVCSSVIDSVVRGSLGTPFRVVWANGNERQGSSCDTEGFGDYYSTAPPATAKNHITVGALNSNDDSMTSFSSWGPTDDGRLKPDISAPGCQSNSDGGVTSPGSGNDSDYSTLCGTSMASPTVAGCVALILEDYRTQFSGPDPRNSTVKILLAQEAADLGNAGPDYQFGYGSVRAQDTIDFMRLGRFEESSIDEPGATFAYSVNATGAESELKVTIAWDDVPGTPNVAGALVNDLDLRVIDPLGGRHYPWTLDPANPGGNAVRVTEDHINNIEQVWVANPIAGTWRVEVYGYDVPSGPQPFSICASHDLTAGPFVQIGFPDGIPSAVPSGTPQTIRASAVGVGEAISGGATLNWRMDAGAFNQTPMTAVGADLFEAPLPAAYCGDTPEFYVSASGATSGAWSSPPDAPTSAFAVDVEDVAVVFADDFETNQGWTVTNTDLSDGGFERGIPAGDGGRNDPLEDFDGSGRCYLTDNVSGNSDVDGGPTTVTSPVIDMSQAGVYRVRYAAWLANDDNDVDDMDVEISNNGGGSWTTVASHGNTSGWTFEEFEVASFLAPTANMRLRFRVTDNPNDSVTEGAFDAVEVVRVTCDDPPPVLTADFTAAPVSGTAPLDVNFSDLSAGTVNSWDWTFGDGASSTDQIPAHTYLLPGTYTVELDVTGPLGTDGETKVDFITAAKPPQVGTPYGSGSAGSLGQPTIAAHSELNLGSALYLVGGNVPQGTAAYLVMSLHDFSSPVDLSNGLVLNVNVPLLVITGASANADGEAITLVNLPGMSLGVPVYAQTIAIDGTGGNFYATSGGVSIPLP